MPWSWKGRWALLTALFCCSVLAQDRGQLCAACHGTDGNSTDAHTPSIAGQPKVFLENQLILFREGVRRSDAMAAVVKGLDDAAIVKLAEHFSRLPAKGMERAMPDSRLMKLGAERAQALRCGMCHLPDYSGQAHIPRLAGQREAYWKRKCAPTATASARGATPSWRRRYTAWATPISGRSPITFREVA